jgi:hypothetical protein
MITWWLVGCEKDPAGLPPVPDEGTGILGTGWANPFPSTDQLGADGHLALRDLPVMPATELPVERLAWRTGFSPAQVSVLRLAGVDDAGFPDGAGEPGEGTVHLVDLTAGREVRCLAELDAYPGASEVSTLIRPLEALPYGHRIAVVVTTGAVARPERFDLLLGDPPPRSLAAVADGYRALIDDLDPFVPAAEIAVAWEFPVGDGRAPLRSALAGVGPSTSHTFDRVRNLEAGDTVAPGTWRVAEGTFTVPDLTGADHLLSLDADGGVTVEGEARAQLYVHVPTSVKDAPAGSVPVMVFGHGIFGDPARYFDDAEDPSGVLALAEDLGVIVVGTLWRGLASPDRLVPITVAGDFGRFPELTDLLVQGQADTAALVRSVREGELLDDPVFEGAAGQSLPDRTRIVYYGISLGAIEGMVLWAQDPEIEQAVFHVGGGMWSTLLERSSNWSAFELLVTPSIENPADRQILYSTSQLWWDPVDPMSWTEELAAGRPFVLQEAVGDEQVANLTTEALARSAGLPVLGPAPYVPSGLAVESADLAAGARALVLFDPQVPLPAPGNRPATVTHAHEIPRTWPGTAAQTATHLDVRTSGEIRHFCGDDPCSADNPGTGR